MSETEKRDEMIRRAIMPNRFGGNGFRSLVLDGVHATDWRPKNTMDDMVNDVATQAAQQRMGDLIKYGMIIVSSLPLLILYPFLQKYFVKGVMIGAIKG